jgi:hypothetical protein
MLNQVSEHRIECQSCRVEICVSVLRDTAVVEKRSLNERVVDYGWLPTSRGYYCRQHAPQAKARFRHPY